MNRRFRDPPRRKVRRFHPAPPRSSKLKKEERLPGAPQIVAKSKNPSFGPTQPECEASALATELIAPNRNFWSSLALNLVD